MALEFDIDEFQGVVSELFRAKLRGSFNSEKSKPYTSRGAFFSNMTTSGIYADLNEREVLRGHGSEISVIELVRKLNPWHSSDFSMEYSPISDERFGCSNNLLLENRGGDSFPDLKGNVMDEEYRKPSCRSCMENRHPDLRNSEMVRTFNDYSPADCALKPMVKAQGLGIRITVEAKFARGVVSLTIKDPLWVGKGIQEEFSHPKISSDSLRPRGLSHQIVRIKFPDFASMKVNEVSHIWRERGFRENLFVGPGASGLGSSEKKNRESEGIDPNRLAKTIISIIERVESVWNPAAYPGPQMFLQRDYYPPIEKRSWPINFLRMNKVTCNFLNSGLKGTGSKKLQNPVLIDEDIELGVVLICLDNTELWR